MDHWLNGIAYQPSHWPDRNVDWREMLRRTWLVTMGGGYPNYYYSHTAWLCRPSSLY